MTPEQRLVAAILQQAYRDMFTAGRAPANGDDGRPDNASIDGAIRFLTDTHGHKAWWRNYYCSLLDLDGDVLAARVRMMLDGAMDVPIDESPTKRDSGIKRHEAGVVRARERWRHLKNPPKTPRTSVVSSCAG